LSYCPARWIPGPDAMTIFGPVFRPQPHVELFRERWELADGDFVDVDRLQGPPDAPLLLALHGLEGSSSAHYSRGLLAQARDRGWRGLALNFRTCSGSVNRLLRSYHSGETGDFDELVRRALRESGCIVVVGCSLGGNVLVKWQGARVPREIRAAAALSVPFDLAACSRTLDGPGFWQFIYRERFLRSLKKKALEKLARFPGAYDGERVRRSKTLDEFDEVVTSRVHGFDGAADYYEKCSSGPFVQNVQTPLLLLSAEDDPFIPASTIPRKVPANVTLEVSARGGHLGFVEGPIWAPRFYAERRAIEFLAGYL
jgi:hypothetical protein